ncbi:MAG: polyphosphate kinase 1 [Oscillospiraceae bacterium]|nr:polyphosphate kinase 1 [Oscillospiraceae bacterium]
MNAAEEKQVFINRELSWLEFDRRVLELAKDKAIPLGEQLKFAAIYASNMDEFFMIRVGSLFEQTLLREQKEENKTKMTPAEQLAAIMPKVRELQEHSDKYVQKLYANLEKYKYQKVDFNNLTKKEEQFWKKYFVEELFPVLSPQVIDRRHPFPFLRNQEVYVGVMLKGKSSTDKFGIIPISTQFERIVYTTKEEITQFALVEELVLHFADNVFGKNAVHSKCVFRVTRNADITVSEGMLDHDIDYRVVMSELLKKRRKLAAVRIQFWGEESPQALKAFLCEKLFLNEKYCFFQTTPLAMSFAFSLAKHLETSGQHKELFYTPMRPMQATAGFSLANAAKKQDVLIAYPYQSMRPFIHMLQQAANDPDVISIKMTLYRVASDSKIVEALISAAENGKEVVTLVELRARFDEQNNIDWSRQLEEAGCTVIYGFEDYKIHSKLTLITKKKGNKFEYISQIGTGNYNEKTAELYTDLALITSDSGIGEEVANVFNSLAVEKNTEETTDLLVAPLCFKSVLMKELDEQIALCKNGKPGQAIIKCNSVSDKEIICKICEASCAGVKVDMIIRGICCMKAGVPGLTENVRIRSLVGRYLEHSRIYAFGVGENKNIYIASGDFLTRNTERRVEVGVRIKEEKIKNTLMYILQLQLADNVNAREMQPDGNYIKIKCNGEKPEIDSQMALYDYLSNAWKNAEQGVPTAGIKREVSTVEKTNKNLWGKMRRWYRNKK